MRSWTEETEATRRARRIGLLAPLGWLLLVGIGLALFALFSVQSDVAGRGIGGDTRFIYARYDPVWRVGPAAVAMGAAAVAGAYVAARLPRVPAAVFLTAAVTFMLGFSASVAMWRGGADGLVGLSLTDKPPQYATDFPIVERVGVRDYVDEYPDIVPQLRSIHSKTHPPGPVLLLYGLERLWPDHLIPRALVIGLLAALVLVPTWFFARIVGGERAARYAVLLAAVSPGLVIFSFTWIDSVFATALMACSALVVWAAAAPDRPTRGVAAGLALALSTFMTYAAGLIVAFAVLHAAMVLPWRRAMKVLAAVATGCLIGVGAMVMTVGYDVFGSYLSFRRFLAVSQFLATRSYTYWLFAVWAAWLIYTGWPAAAIGLRGLVAQRPRYLVASLVPLLILGSLPFSISKLLQGETERTWLFAMPVLVTAAAATLARWEDAHGRRARVVAALVGLTAAQTIVLKALYFNY